MHFLLDEHNNLIVLYETTNEVGDYVLYEATKTNNYDRVSHTTRTIASLSTYTAIRYDDVY